MQRKDDLESHLDFYRRWGLMAEPYFQWQMQQFSEYMGQRVGEIGCGLGNFVKFFSKKEIYLGFDCDETLVREFKLIHKKNNIKLADNGDICKDKAVEELKSNRIDTILCVNVLEHIANDALALNNMVKGICSNGFICILVPAFPFLHGTLDKLDNHYRRYTKRSMLNLFRNQNVTLVKSYYINFLGGIGWFIKARLLKEKCHKNENYLFTNKLLPLISFIERKIHPFFGLSLAIVLKKN